jgi:triosephosphate isomerase
MTKRKKIIVGNWKMNPGTLAEAKILFGKVKRVSGKLAFVETVLCPPFVYLGALAGAKGVKLGAQDSFWENEGRFTGEVSPNMLNALGISHVIIGHSERRALGETNEIISKKIDAVLEKGLKVILCVGEKERDASGSYFEFLKNQIKQSLLGIDQKFLRNLLVAYEPLWAVGKSFHEAMQPAEIRETVIFIRKILSDIYGRETVANIPIIYGGAVETENVVSVFRDGGVNGVLVGHKSLVPEDFISIIKSVNDIQF